MTPIHNISSLFTATNGNLANAKSLDSAAVPPALLKRSNDRTAQAGAADRVAVDKPDLKETFTQFVGETFYGQLIKSMRQTVEKPAYMHGGRAEEVFQGQLDQLLSEHMTEASADQIAGPMFELYNLAGSR